LALLQPADQELVSGFIMNKFRGDLSLLDDGLERFAALTGRPFYGVLPWVRDVMIDAEDSLDLNAYRARVAATTETALRVAVVRLRSMSNFTDFEPLVMEPGVSVSFTDSVSDIREADLVILPGSKSTVADLRVLRNEGLDVAIRARAEQGRPILGVCGGYQMLGDEIIDHVESGAGEVAGLALLPVITEFGEDKILARRAGTSPVLDADCEGYEIRHGHPRRVSGEPMLITSDGEEGCIRGAVWGTSWHGIFESDAFRRAFLAWTAAENAVEWSPGPISFQAEREAQADRLAALIRDHADTGSLMRLIEQGPPEDLPVLGPAGVA
jgi:adenosylcobyric acid synthase